MIDLANLDKRSNAVVFVELKQLSDIRLHSGEVNQQIEKYIAFTHDHKGRDHRGLPECNPG